MSGLDKEWGLERGLVRTIFAPCASVLAEHLAGHSPLRRILDVGCGSGIAGRTIAERWPSITTVCGLDLGAAAVRVARDVTGADPRFEFREVDATQFQAKELFDAVVAQHLLHQLGEHAGAALRRMHASLRPGGRIVIGQWPDLERCPAYAFIYKAAGEYEEKKAKERPVSEAQIHDWIRAIPELRIVSSCLMTAFSTPPIAPRELVRQYFEGSQRWLERRACDATAWTASLGSARLQELAILHGRPAAGAFTFGLSMLVVVAQDSRAPD